MYAICKEHINKISTAYCPDCLIDSLRQQLIEAQAEVSRLSAKNAVSVMIKATETYKRAEKAERRNIDLQLKTQDAIAIMQGKLDSKREENKRLSEALKDMLSGWRYIRDTHGDMYGVGWERAQEKAEQALKGEDRGH